jgi:mRNA degradation ribonuclease J1/J2
MHFYQLHASGHLNKDQLIDLVNEIQPALHTKNQYLFNEIQPALHTKNQYLFNAYCSNVQTIEYEKPYIL